MASEVGNHTDVLEGPSAEAGACAAPPDGRRGDVRARVGGASSHPRLKIQNPNGARVGGEGRGEG